jgi:hypothetical protein
MSIRVTLEIILGLDANRKKGNFEKDLDDMLFGGFGAPPPRRRPAAETKPAEQSKPVVQPGQPTNVPTVPATNTSKPTQPVVNEAAKNLAALIKPEVTPKTSPPKNPIISTKPSTDVNKSTDSGKNVNTSGQGGQGGQGQGGSTINIIGKVVVTPGSKPAVITNRKNEPLNPSILVPSNEVDNKAPTINNIPIDSQPVLPPSKKVDNYVNPSKQAEKKPEPAINVPAQPTRYEETITIDVLHPFSIKNQFNKPGNLRKLKKVAEDFKFAEENLALHNAVDVIRPFETDRSRQRKLNDFDFKDYEFPSSSISLGGEHKGKPSVWKKQNELAKTASFGKYVDPNDLNPGSLSNPHFVSSLSAIAELEANTKRLIEDQKANGNGFYLIRLFINSVWRYIAVESTLPFINGENAGIVSNPDSEF